jgi:hypothetical protein
MKSDKSTKSRTVTTEPITFKFERDTKGAVRFQEVVDGDAIVEMADAAVGTLYVRKSFLASIGIKEKLPATATITITFA